jgi:hypothetical protein
MFESNLENGPANYTCLLNYIITLNDLNILSMLMLNIHI